jgi:hypothetical protein
MLMHAKYIFFNQGLLKLLFKGSLVGNSSNKCNFCPCTRKNCFRYLKLMSPHNKWYYIKKTIIWPWGHYGMHPHTKYHWPISKDKKVMVRKQFFLVQGQKLHLLLELPTRLPLNNNLRSPIKYSWGPATDFAH